MEDAAILLLQESHIPPLHPSACVCGLQNLGFGIFLFFPQRTFVSQEVEMKHAQVS